MAHRVFHCCRWHSQRDGFFHGLEAPLATLKELVDEEQLAHLRVPLDVLTVRRCTEAEIERVPAPPAGE
eukprot:2612757-Amphidinium_carterae.1